MRETWLEKNLATNRIKTRLPVSEKSAKIHWPLYVSCCHQSPTVYDINARKYRKIPSLVILRKVE